MTLSTDLFTYSDSCFSAFVSDLPGKKFPMELTLVSAKTGNKKSFSLEYISEDHTFTYTGLEGKLRLVIFND